ncbi:hypothetical protein, partial [Xanthovirga aplysinae]|uniref:hypothetical protein n=1 Tax=Xanthovirga aplysinae TaxID=2529853 RepID=UPI001656AECD
INGDRNDWNTQEIRSHQEGGDHDIGEINEIEGNNNDDNDQKGWVNQVGESNNEVTEINKIEGNNNNNNSQKFDGDQAGDENVIQSSNIMEGDRND